MREAIAILVFPLTIAVMIIAFGCWLIGGIEDWVRDNLKL